MKSTHVALGVGAALAVGGGYFYFRSKSKKPAGQYYPGAQGIPGKVGGGAPQNFNAPTPSQALAAIGQGSSSQTAQLIASSGAVAVALLPSIRDLFSSGSGGFDGGGIDPGIAEPTGSIEGLPGFDEQGI
jgi:hypothetical protein